MTINNIEKNLQNREELKITGLSDVLNFIKEKLSNDNSSVIIIDGPAGAGKSWFSMILAEKLLPLIENGSLESIQSETNLPISFEKYTDLNPKLKIKNNILGVDLFYHDRESKHRKKTNIFHWMRFSLLKKTVLEILEKKESGDKIASIKLDVFLHSAGLEKRKFSLPIEKGPLIIEGFGAMGLVPTLEKMGYNTINIAVVAKKDLRLDRGKKRGESRGKDPDKTLDHLKQFTEPTWKRYWPAVILKNLDLVVESEDNKMDLKVASNLSSEELENLLK